MRQLHAHATRGLVERDDALRLAIIAMLAGEHLLLVGPPGTAKSEVARRLRLVVRDAPWFERLLTRFTVPEEIFGPLSIRGLQNDVYERLGAGYLPTAHVAFLDEIFRANSAILNALLGILNEREVDVGARRERVPLVCLVAACNQIPDDDDLEALNDRFALRHELAPVSAEAFAAMLEAEPPSPPEDAERLSTHDLERLRAAVDEVVLPAFCLDVVRDVRAEIAKRGVYVSDRRWKKAVRILRASALLAGREAVSLPDLALLPACAWRRPADRQGVEAIVKGQLDAIVKDEPARYAAIVESIEKAVAEDVAGTRQTIERGKPVFVNLEGYPTTAPETTRQARSTRGELLFHPPPHRSDDTRSTYTLDELREAFHGSVDDVRAYVAHPASRLMETLPHEPLVERPSLPRAHVERRLAQVERILADLSAFRDAVRATSCIDGEAAALRLDALATRLEASADALRTVPTHDLLAAS